MDIQEQAVLLIAKERLEDALRAAEQRRGAPIVRLPRPWTRAVLGMFLVRVGGWVQSKGTNVGRRPGVRYRRGRMRARTACRLQKEPIMMTASSDQGRTSKVPTTTA